MAEEVDVSELNIGDKVYIRTYEEKPIVHTVAGIAPDDTFRNGDVSNLPYVDLYGRDGIIHGIATTIYTGRSGDIRKGKTNDR